MTTMSTSPGRAPPRLQWATAATRETRPLQRVPRLAPDQLVLMVVIRPG
ncbi:hypothetical protein BXY51_008506 [Actinoplanes cyaneus]|nr:hypothetical protein [Actinoplanes cyaneus]